jgi:hypothetical protein
MAQADLHIDASTPGEIARSNTASPAAFRWIPSMVKCSGMAGKAIKPAPASLASSGRIALQLSIVAPPSLSSPPPCEACVQAVSGDNAAPRWRYGRPRHGW